MDDVSLLLPVDIVGAIWDDRESEIPAFSADDLLAILSDACYEWTWDEVDADGDDR
jgi:hypothetical protein